MKNLSIIIVVVVLAGVAGYFTLTENGDNKGLSTNKTSLGMQDEETQEPTELADFEACEIALEKLNADVDCLENMVTYAGKDAAVVYMQGGEVENAVVLSDGSVVPISTNLYFSPSVEVKKYVKKESGIELTDDDIENAVSELRISKRGYLYGLTFSEDYTGVIYITPEGRISGRLKK